jgi:hypothetical protein
MAKAGKSAQCCDKGSGAFYGALAGLAIAVLHQVLHAINYAVPDDLYVHVFGELAIGALGGAALLEAGSAACNWIKGRQEPR